MDKIDKFLKKISEKERIEIEKLVDLVVQNSVECLDCKKLKGYDNFFRVRKGKVRIIFQKNNDDNIILSIEHRSDKTYKKF
ncbi:type II toxin-antitoxin system RelE/ParE family toxin [Patescibacteria group bacterium]